MRRRTGVVVFLAILAVIAGIMNLLDAARYMGWLPVSITTILGEYQFVLPQAYWLGAIMAVIVGLIWFSVANQLWNLNPQGWIFVVAIAVVNLVFLFVALIGATPFMAILWPLIINVLALVLAMLPSTRTAFGQP
ncbi:MAG: hypothetical protein H6642_07915 [Caldilineaceae bacterium]|nr:hypothetical protein [Caldilineaceae bacterium]MCB9138255.1 hypothetical protein [Caldilineaceae bacterium]